MTVILLDVLVSCFINVFVNPLMPDDIWSPHGKPDLNDENIQPSHAQSSLLNCAVICELNSYVLVLS